MTRDIQYVPASAPAEEITAILKADGVVVLTGAATADEVNIANFELEPYIRRTPTGKGFFYGETTRRTSALVAKSETMADWAIRPGILGPCEAVLKEECSSIQLNLTQLIRIEPGERPQIMHRDEDLFPIARKAPVELMINCIWALSPFTAENGATRVVPGSHTWDKDRLAEPHEVRRAIMNPGDVVIFLGSTLHGGGANTSDQPRTGAVISYNLGWLRQTENFFLSVPWEKAAAMPERLQRLLGYQIHLPNVGWVEGRDPLDWMNAGRPDVMEARDALTPEQEELVAIVGEHPELMAPYLV
ncbi:MAG: phytanoyl-CoA dioxygenase family protein [Caulobacterales bacterium]|uniref:phytanoyl-CoA dioxygenase family protein n=1 Tax=Glycocaulis sp. TaxID=1969725 RepID=UPI003F9EEA59